MEIKIEGKICPICKKPLVTHPIRQKALDRFMNSKASIRNKDNDNVMKRYARSLAKTSQINSLRAIMKFCRIVHKTPAELINMGYKKISENYEIRDTSEIEKMLEDFETYCLEAYQNPTLDFAKILPKNTCLLIGKSVRGFFRVNKFDLPQETLSNLFSMRIDKKKDYVPTKKDIKRFISYANPRDKLLFEFATNIPLRRQEITGQDVTGEWSLTGLTWAKLGDLSQPYPMIVFKDYELKGRAKKKYQGCLFIGILCESLRKKLLTRKDEERLRFQKEKEKWESKGYVFKSEFSENTKVFLSSEVTIEGKTVTIEPLSYKAIGHAQTTIQRRTKLGLSIHLLRDYLQNMLNAHAREDFNSVYANAMLSHKIEGTARFYSHPEQQYDQVLEVFKKVEPYIDLDYDETKIQNIMLQKAKELRKKLKKEGKSEDEILEKVIGKIMKERTQMLIADMAILKDTMLSEIKNAEIQHKRRTTE